MKSSSRRAASAKGTSRSSSRGAKETSRSALEKRELLQEKLKTTEEALEAAQKIIAGHQRREKETKQLLATKVLTDESLNSDPIIEAKVAALNNVHAQKVKSLMNSISSLRKQMETMKAGDKEHRRSALIQSLRKQQKEKDLIVDVLKETLKEKCSEFGQSAERVNEYVIKKTVGGPKRFRPKTREELELELTSLDKKLNRTISKLKEAQAKNNQSSYYKEEKQPEQQYQPAESKQVNQSDDDEENVPELLEELEKLKVLVSSRDIHIRNQDEEIDALQQQIRELKLIEDKFLRMQSKYKSGKDKLRSLEEENLRLLEEKEREFERRQQAVAELQFLQQSKNQHFTSSDETRLNQLERIKELQQREIQLQTEIESCQKKASADRCEFNNRLRNYEAKLAEVQKQAEEKSHDNSSELLKQIEDRESRIRELQLQSEAKSADTESETKADDTKRDDSLEKVEALNEEIATKTSEIKALEKQVTACKVLARQSKKEKDTLEQKISALEQQLKEVQSADQTNDMKHQLSKLEEQLSSEMKAHGHCQQQLCEANETITDLQNQLTSLGTSSSAKNHTTSENTPVTSEDKDDLGDHEDDEEEEDDEASEYSTDPGTSPRPSQQ